MPTYRRSVDLMEAALGDELVALDPDAGKCFGFNSVSASVWNELKEPKTFDQLCGFLLSEYDVTVEQCRLELKDLLDDLCSKGLVTTDR